MPANVSGLISISLVVALTIIGGCSSSCTTDKRDDSNGVDTREGMIEYLNARRLPALVSIEKWEDYPQGLKLTTDHYEIHTTLLEPLMLSEIPGFVESAYRGYNKQLPKPIDETNHRFVMYLFGERQEWEEFTDDFAGSRASVYKKIKAGAYYLNGACVMYNIGRGRTFSVLGHEGWHQFNTRHFHYRLPSWIDEGVAMMFEASRYEDGFFYFEPQRNLHRLGSLKITLAKQKIIPLRQLIGMNPGEALVQSDDAVNAFYAQAYALARFLREDEYGKRLSNFHQMLMGAVDGSWPLDASAARIAADRNIPLTVRWNRAVGLLLFEYYINEDLESLEDQYLKFCRKIVYHVRVKE